MSRGGKELEPSTGGGGGRALLSRGSVNDDGARVGARSPIPTSHVPVSYGIRSRGNLRAPGRPGLHRVPGPEDDLVPRVDEVGRDRARNGAGTHDSNLAMGSDMRQGLLRVIACDGSRSGDGKV